jgi:DNA adenine methylase
MIPYIGGKCQLAPWIISNFPENHLQMSYIEVFGGAGWILYKKEVARLEIYNDLNSNLVNLFTTIRDNYPAFSHQVEWSLHSREMFSQSIEFFKNHQVKFDIIEALNYAIMRVQSFSGKGKNSWAYIKSPTSKNSGTWAPFLKRLGLINARLKLVQIEHLNYAKLIEKYDTPNSLFYLDPPYVKAEHYYNNSEVFFTHEDHFNLSRILYDLQGKFCLSYYDEPMIRELYKDYRILTKTTTKSSCGVTKLSKRKVKPKARELLIMNY